MNTCYCDKPTLYLRKQGLNSRAFANLWVFSFFLQTDWWIFLMLQARFKQDSYSNEQNRCSVFLTTKFKLRFKMPQKNCYFEIFVSSIYVKGCLGWKIFPPKNLEKIRRPKYACAKFFFVCFIQVIFFKFSLKW